LILKSLFKKSKQGNTMKRLGIITFILTAMVVLATPSWAAKGIVTITIKPNEFASISDNARVWLPYPISDSHQEISDIRIQGNASYYAVYNDQDNGASHLFAHWNGGVSDKNLVLQFMARTEERSAGRLRDDGLPIPASIEQYLQPSALIPTDGEIGKLAQNIIAGKNGVLEKAHAVYNWMVENTVRDPSVKGCGLGIVEITLTKRSGKCADLSSVYVALARAAGVPAREVFGLRLGKKIEQDMTGGYHCWAEFYLPGTGWVQVDPADVRKIMLIDKIELAHTKTKDLRTFYFGSVDAYRIILRHGGRGLQLKPEQRAGPLNYFMYPYAEIDGKELDYFNPKTFQYSVHFKAVK
jgi:hypothetical protein